MTMSSSAIADAARRIGVEVAGPAADDVHEKARHPVEAIDALKDARLLGMLVPVELGGEGARIADVVNAIRLLAQHCTSAAMVLAMHQIQVAMLVHHGATDELRAFVRDLAREQLLVANAVSEVGVGGDNSRSLCAIARDERGCFRLDKHASALSYGASADAIIATACAVAGGDEHDQVVVLTRQPDFELEPTGTWDAMGLRGTDSRSFWLHARGPAGFVFPAAGRDVLGHAGLATNNLFQCSVWLGLAEGAAARTHTSVRARARKDTDAATMPAMRLAELKVELERLRDTIGRGAQRAEAVLAGDEPAGPGLALAMNTLKVSASSAALDVVGRAMLISGIEGYRGGSALSLGRHLADAFGAAVMVSNDRALRNNAELLKFLKTL